MKNYLNQAQTILRKTIFFAIFALTLVSCGFNNPDAHFNIGDLCYVLYTNKTAEVTFTKDQVPYSMDTIVIPETVKYCGGTYTVTSIGGGAFNGCSNLKSIVMPSTIRSIGNAAFAECVGLTSFNVPSHIISVGDQAFLRCTGLTTVTISEGVKSIGNSAFCQCPNLTSFTLANSVESIGWCAFDESGLTSLVYNKQIFAYMPKSFSGEYTIPDGIKTIVYGAFSGCENLASVTIPNSVESIGAYAFSGCKNLTSVSISDNVKRIENCSFSSCSSLKTITIPNSVTSIGTYAVANCDSLTSITIGSGVVSIEGGAFLYCGNLTQVSCYAVNPPQVDCENSHVYHIFYFDDRSKATLYVPAGSVEAYKKADQWKDFGSILPL